MRLHRLFHSQQSKNTHLLLFYRIVALTASRHHHLERELALGEEIMGVSKVSRIEDLALELLCPRSMANLLGSPHVLEHLVHSRSHDQTK